MDIFLMSACRTPIGAFASLRSAFTKEGTVTYGAPSLCVGGAMGTAKIVERV